jgi:hypothetical protein
MILEHPIWGDVVDKFEQAMQQMRQMTKEDRMKMIESKKELCICGGCPTYNDCARESARASAKLL